MDGDQRMKQHERLMARSGNGAAGGRATDRFESTMHPRGDPTGMSQAPDRTLMSYDYGYTGSSFHGGSLQPNEVQAYPADFARPRQAPASQPIQMHPQQQQPQSQQPRRRAPQDVAPFVPYESASMLYGFSQQDPAQGPFDVVPQYPTRPSAAIEALSNHFAVPQYFAPEEPPGSAIPGLSSYLNASQLSYNQPGPMARPNISQPFPATMTEFTPTGAAATSRLDPPPAQQQPDPSQLPSSHSSSLDEAYGQYQRALRSTFDQTRAGRLVEASRSLMEISEWLVTNARDLGILRDDHLLYPDRLRLWNDFNLCWLAVCQRQKGLIQDMVVSGHPPAQASLISRDRMESMGKDLIQLCDQLEQHGLVDYQIGIWEEEILSVLSQCLDLMESNPEGHRIRSMPEPATAAPRP
ncbi:uncharacterized protein N7459_009694 [Penicillium hispanicum]|uniref:uncharacterized protein n=1 Tax=Penicillium hispanicum TaxID=1080232 RepID=UPI002540D29A|nr:uncharacterized protein N7459_009694 [Penicillium hispanicum]KAJ5570264.1 hypothetical protein N7459_009694 [Penicillium hispanicum]